jgi:hypothetical protein
MITNSALFKCALPPPPAGVFLRAARLAFLLACVGIALFGAQRISAQGVPEIAGRIDGQNFSVEAPTNSMLPEGSPANTVVSGSRVIVRTGQARIVLTGGGEILICGSAQLELVKAGGAVTIALDYGVLHLTLGRAEQVAVLTPFVLATPVSVGGGALDVTIGLEQDGRMCLQAARGALRIQQQLGDQTILVPQLGGLTLSGGQVTSFAGGAPGCACKADIAKLTPKESIRTQETLGAVLPPTARPIAPPVPAARAETNSAPPPTTSQNPADVPIYKVLMPPLAYDANAPDLQPGPTPEMFVLIKSVRVREEIIFTGTILPGGKHDTHATTAQTNVGTEVPHPKILARIGSFFRRLFGFGG